MAIKAVAQDMDLVVLPGVDLDAAVDLKPQFFGLVLGLPKARDAVVVGQKQELDLGLGRPGDELARVKGPVRIKGMGVEVYSQKLQSTFLGGCSAKSASKVTPSRYSSISPPSFCQMGEMPQLP